MRVWNSFVLALTLLLVPALPPGGASLRAAELQTLEVVTKSGVRTFAVEMAVTEAELSKGLMHRTELPEGSGMLFDFKQERLITMWMKDTPLSLDMIFIAGNGAIVRIAENTTPLSTRTIGSGTPALAVLEVVGGTARKLGIAAGDRVVHPMFRRR